MYTFLLTRSFQPPSCLLLAFGALVRAACAARAACSARVAHRVMGQKLRGPWARAARHARVLYPGLVRLRLRGRPLALLSIVYVLMIIATGWYLVVPRVLLYRILVARSSTPANAAGLVTAEANGPVAAAPGLAQPRGRGSAIDGRSEGEAIDNSDGNSGGGPSSDRSSGNWPLPEFLLLCVFKTTLFFCLVSYLLTALCDPGPVPDTWRPIYAAAVTRQRSPAPAPSPLTPPSSVPALGASNSLRPSEAYPAPSAASGRTVTDASSARAENADDTVAPVATSAPQRGYHSDVSVSSPSRQLVSSSPSIVQLAREPLQVGQPIPPPVVYSAAALGSDGNPRFCRTCRVYKPARTHHCTVCRRCKLPLLSSCLEVPAAATGQVRSRTR
jgi:hypothetical protein